MPRRRTVGGVTDDEVALARWWSDFARTECRGYSPLYERSCETVARSPEVLALALSAPVPGRQPNVLLAAAHDLVLRGVDHPLGAWYAQAAAGGSLGDAALDAAAGAFVDLVLDQRDEVALLLATRRTNTNECGRSAVLAPALRWAAARLDAEDGLALLDGGTSAGLNLRLDRYLLDYGDAGRTGSADAPVRVRCSVEGPAPIADEVVPLLGRVGLDRSPVDLDDETQARWLVACVWPDTGRLERTRAAIEVARTHPVEVVEGDLVDGLPTALARLPRGAPVVVTTTWVLAYLRPEHRLRFVDALATASETVPIVWVSAEAPGVVPGAIGDQAPDDGDDGTTSVVGGWRFAGGHAAEAVVLGRCHPHGATLRWTAA
jgi:hypothetical protein